jgi:hypothetical protein
MSKTQFFALSLSMVLLSACSGKPDVDIIEPGLKEAWSQCQGLKVSGLKKLSGEKNGEAYAMNFSYNLELLANDPSEACAGNQQSVIKLASVMLANNKELKDVKKGDVVTVNGAVNFVKSADGWVLQ